MSARNDSPVRPAISMPMDSDYVDQEKTGTKDLLANSGEATMKEASDNEHGTNEALTNNYVTGWKLAFIVL